MFIYHAGVHTCADNLQMLHPLSHYVIITTGRKTAILFTDIIFIIGSIILFLSESFETVLIGRFVVGFAVAVSGIADVAYLHEISPMEYRGAIVSVNEACISFGFMVSYLAGYGLTLLDPDNGWRIMFGVR